jgi:hypothetical protein
VLLQACALWAVRAALNMLTSLVACVAVRVNNLARLGVTVSAVDWVAAKLRLNATVSDGTCACKHVIGKVTRKV